jgi:hypothetical protein
MDLEQLDDGCIRVCLTEDGITACTTVSSHHLTWEKEADLRAAIAREAAAAFRVDPMDA